MATNGILSVMVDGKVAQKIVVGCNGNNLEHVAAFVYYLGRPLLETEADLMCKRHRAGCDDCLVIQFHDRDVRKNRCDPFNEMYTKLFEDPMANPRWGAEWASRAPYTKVIYL